MNFGSPFVILIAVAMGLSIINLIKPAWPILGVAVLLVCVACLIGKA